MEDLLTLIRAASGAGATSETRHAAASACRTLLQALEAAPGDALAGQAPPTAAHVEPVAPRDAEQPQLVIPPVAVPAAALAGPVASAHSSVVGALPDAPSRSIDPTAVAAIVASLRGIPPEQLLDIAIARLRAALPPAPAMAPVAQPLRFQLVPVPAQSSPPRRGGR
jgi:hypothetical protein